MSTLKKVQHLQWTGSLIMKWKFLPWTHEIPPWGGIPPRLGTTELTLVISNIKEFILKQLCALLTSSTATK